MNVAARAPDDGNLERPAPTVVVATMRRRHLRGVLQIEQQVYPRPWTFGLFLSELGQRSTRLYLVARIGHKVVGYLGMLRSLEDGHITTIAVDPAWHRNGIATRLMAVAARASVTRGCRNLTLEVRVSNHGAQDLYRRFGFVPAGIRRGYYPENGEDALVMWATDVDGAAYARRLSEIEARVPGFTLIEGDWV
jgi:ribosomal-protein-alanine N-acetyltransferase